MANLSLRRVMLYDKWPGIPNLNAGIPTGGFDATSGHSCVTAPVYPPMTKIQAYQRGSDASDCQGPYTMIYLAFNEMSGVNPIACGSTGTVVCGHIDSTAWTSIGHWGDGSAAPYTVTNNSACMDATSHGQIAIGVQKSGAADSDTTATTYRWQWFWCGGVCPFTDMTQLDHDMTCTVTAHNHVQPVVDTSALVLGVGDASFESICGLATTVSA